MSRVVERLLGGWVVGGGGWEGKGVGIEVEGEKCVVIEKFEEKEYGVKNGGEEYVVWVGDCLVSVGMWKGMGGWEYGGLGYIERV